MQFSPNVELCDSIREFTTTNHTQSFADKIFPIDIGADDNIFTQYCSFKRKGDNKNSQLMAWHPDSLHEGLTKITQFCDQRVKDWGSRKLDKFIMDVLFLPVLVLGGKLYEMRKISDTVSLDETTNSKMVYNYHINDEPKTILIYVVTKKGFLDFMNKMLNLQREMYVLLDDIEKNSKK